MISCGYVLIAGFGLFFWGWFAVEEQIPLTDSAHPSTWCGVSQQLSLNHTHGWNTLLHWSVLSLTLLLYCQNLDTLVIPGLSTHTWITWEIEHQCLGSVFLLIILLFSLVIPHQLWLPSLFYFHWTGLSLHLFSKLLSLFLPIQNVFPCLQNWTLTYYSSVPLSVSSLLLHFILDMSQFAVLRCFVALLLFVAELYNSTKVLLSFWYLVFHFFYFQS